MDHIAAAAAMSVQERSSFETLLDGSIGSFAVQSGRQDRRRERVAAEFSFADADGEPVLITAFSRDKLFISSIDFFRSDFSPLKCFPEPDDLKAIGFAEGASQLQSIETRS